MGDENVHVYVHEHVHELGGANKGGTQYLVLWTRMLYFQQGVYQL
jgi:hypothetical protein